MCLDGGFSPLYKACCEGFDKCVILLLNNCAAINLCNNNGGSPLYIACENGHEEIVQRLLNNGADEITEQVLSVYLVKTDMTVP